VPCVRRTPCEPRAFGYAVFFVGVVPLFVEVLPRKFTHERGGKKVRIRTLQDSVNSTVPANCDCLGYRERGTLRFLRFLQPSSGAGFSSFLSKSPAMGWTFGGFATFALFFPCTCGPDRWGDFESGHRLVTPLRVWGGSWIFRHETSVSACTGRYRNRFCYLSSPFFCLCTHGAVTSPPATTQVERLLRIQFCVGW